jgi:hypothetical protein
MLIPLEETKAYQSIFCEGEAKGPLLLPTPSFIEVYGELMARRSGILRQQRRDQAGAGR